MNKLLVCFVTLLVLFIPSPSLAGIPAEAKGTLKGQLLDRETGAPLDFAYVHLEEINRTATAHSDGTFEINNIPVGTYTLTAYRIGYQTISQKITINSDKTTTAELTLKPTVLSSEAVEIVGQTDRANGAGLEHASRSISGTELRQNLSTTLAQTLDQMPGLESRTMGAAPSRPVMRGLGGERVLILQDGERTGDVSSQSSDHAVTVDPMAAEEIEIARGPAALQYGSNAIGGVINVVRNQIATSLPNHIHGTASLQGESVNTGGSSGLEAGFPIGNIAVQLDGSIRGAKNIQTPVGELENSSIFSTNNAVGLSYIRPWGYAGTAASMYLNHYGIPPNPDGGHEEGVRIEMQKLQFEGKTEVFLTESIFKSVDTDFSYKNYYHQEIEHGGTPGTEFGALTANASVSVRHRSYGILDEGTVGIWGEAKNYAVQGARTPDSDAYSLAAYLIEEKDFGALHLEAGARIDYINILPAEERESRQIGAIRSRRFTGVSSSVSGIYNMGSGFYLGSTFMHSFRAPSQEELYSEGPHLASYSYEIGNPDLDPERGLGKELFLRYKQSDASIEVTGYHNSFTNYIYPRNTGEPSLRFPDLNEYQFIGARAKFYGFEAAAQVKLTNRIALDGTISYTYADREITEKEQKTIGQDNEWQPLPMIPPLKGRLTLKYASGGFRIGANATLAAAQTRTGDFETPTDGYAIFDVFGQYRFQTAELLHTISLSADNLLNREYYSHLSRIKDIMPEPGRNISLLYRMYF